jgi:hypothetical protein
MKEVDKENLGRWSIKEDKREGRKIIHDLVIDSSFSFSH